jgi:hypothetical protein
MVLFLDDFADLKAGLSLGKSHQISGLDFEHFGLD